MHSNGALSRHAPIRVLFMKDVVSAERVGTNAAANVTISPAVKAQALFATRREIILRPETSFAPNTEYQISIKADGLDGVPKGTKPFEFTVRTYEVNFEINVGALNVVHDKHELMSLSGSIGTSDTEPREKLEKILTATLDDKPIAISWIGGDRNYRLRDPRHPPRERRRANPHAALGRRAAGAATTRARKARACRRWMSSR